MSRNISWINEIKNNTSDAYIMWCWDTDNEGEFKNMVDRKLVGRNDGGKWVIIQPHAHLSVTGCGVPDGGDKDGRGKCRVLCKKSSAAHHDSSKDPGRGLRLNRVMGEGKTDKLVLRNHETTKEFASIAFPRGLEQNLILSIDPDGIHLSVKEQKESTEWKAYKFGDELGKFMLTTLQEVAKLALSAAAAL